MSGKKTTLREEWALSGRSKEGIDFSSWCQRVKTPVNDWPTGRSQKEKFRTVSHVGDAHPSAPSWGSWRKVVRAYSLPSASRALTLSGEAPVFDVCPVLNRAHPVLAGPL